MRKLKRVLALILTVLMVLPSFVTVFAETVSVDGVTLNRASSYLSAGDTITLTATVTPADATDTSVTWSSSDDTVATVENGVVTAHKGGNATITATTVDGGYTAECDITVIANDEVIHASYYGSSLVLEGRIGVKIYVDVNEETVDNAELKVTTVNADRVCDEDDPNYSTLYRVEQTVTPVKDALSGDKYYAVLSVPAKDIDNISFETEILVYLKDDSDTPVSAGSMSFDVVSYIASAKKLAEEGDAKFVEALPLVESLETYCNYADNYFNKGSLDAYESDAESIAFNEEKTEGALTGATYYGTSIILEDNVTIRHYFAVSDLNAFNAAHTCDIEYGTNGGYIYFDIEDISAQHIGVAQTLTINNKDGSEAFSVEYSVGNYITAMLNNADGRLVSLVNAIYDYYVEAKIYNAPDEPVTDSDETKVDDWSNN